MKISPSQLTQIYRHAQADYPAECFGFLVGIAENGGRVKQVIPGNNVLSAEPGRFEMAPDDFIATIGQAEAAGLDIIGLYHSHPDHPAIPSQTDLLSDVEGFAYLIVAVHNGQPVDARAWAIAADKPRRFIPQPLEIVDEREASDD